MSDNIKVVVKVRPLISREIEEKLSYQWRVKNDTLHQIDQNGRDLGTCFTFDKVYDKDTDTSEVYDDVAKPIVEAAIAGFNGTIFAYGQTSSGKTYTMFGTEELPGIIPRAIVNLFDRIKRIPDRDFLVRVSYIEIYNETVKDLLSIEKKNVKIHDTVNGVKVDVTERVTASPEEVLEAMKEGEENRQTGATNMNEESSRSHSIFQITIESREHVEGEEEVGCVNVSQLNLVDLAGSERAGQTGATGLRFKEGTHINKSLSVLAMVIKQLSERGAQNPHKYINYRDSKLTRILQNSLGGNAKTSIICAVTPASVEETISTLQFANRAKAIENKPEVNAVATNASMIQTLTKQLSELQSQLEGKKNLEQDNANLQKQICNLQKLILNGFGQKSGIDLMSQSRRKMQQLRRVTISTLHPIIEAEDAVPKVPKFCTPGLKYNPLSLSTSDFVPIQNASKTSLAILPEEAGRMVTPPLQTGQKTIGEESIINLDDSDENSSISSEVKICSPYHKCFGQLKTPPCVLRKNAKEAEKNYKDIVQLTEREKMYTPNTVELLEKLEENVNTIAKLEEEVNHLREQGNEKNTEIQELKAKIAQTGEEFKIVLDNNKKLEIQCNDLEVSYETLQKKSKSREDDLLLLLEEEKASKKADEIRKSVSRELNFMDMSKDISLVNSDTETSVTANAIEMESSSQINELVTELQTQLSSKIDIILKLESNLYAEKQRIESLDSSVKKLNTMIDGFNSKVPRLETENSFLQSTIETLNATIEKQKVHLETANKDMESYNSTIQELQIKLSKKDSMHNVKVNDSLLETMITNEENILANNENMRNIVNTFKVVLDARNKEIDSLKSEIQNHSELESHNIFLKEDVEIKEKQINILTDQVEKLKDQLTENNETINSLLENEKRICSKLVDAQNQSEILQKHNEETKLQANDLIQKNDELNDIVQELNTKLVDSQNQMKIQKVDSVTQIRDLEDSNLKLKHAVEELNTKLIDIQGQNDTLKTEIEEKVANINHLKEKNLQLANSVAEKEAFEKVIQAKHDVLTKEYDSVSQKINHLEQEINLKHDDVTAQNNENDKHTKEFLTNMKVILMNVKDVVFLLGNEFWEIPEHIDSFESVLNVLVDGMKNIRVTAKQLLEERDQAINDINQIKKELSALKDQYKTETLKLCENIEKLNKKNDEVEKLNGELLLQVTSLQENLSTIRNELKTEKQNVVILESQLNDTKDLIENLRNDLHSKDDISSFENEVESLNSEVLLLRQSNEDAKAEFQLLLGKQNDLQDELKAKDQVISEIENKIEEIVSQKVNKAKQTTVAAVLHDILEQLLNVIRDSNAKIDAFARCDDDDDEGENIQKQIIFIVKQLSESIPHPVVKNKENESECQKADVLNKCECQNCVKEIVAQTKNDIEKLTEKNLQLMHEFVAIDRKNQELMSETHSKDSCNKDLLETSELLANLKFELTAKSNEFLSMEKKASEWRDQFIDLQSAMQQQILQLQLENKQLSIRLLELNGESNEDFNKRNSPLSLATICARNIISVIQADCKSNSVSSAPSKSSIASLDAHTQVNICECSDMSQKLSTMMEDNMKLMSALKEQESVNKDLLNEREAVRKEIQLLIEPTNELQKKIVNHRTNLSTLTATTYAENSLLQSQLKVLKHHHTRYINVCQRDIPTFKTQLQELMMILKDNESFVDKNNTSFKRYSLPDVLDINASRANSKNESCLDGDVLMLDTNVTLAESTLICEDQTCLDFTQSNFDNDASYQVAETTKAIDLYAQIEWLKYDDKKLTENLQELKEENIKLRAQIESFSLNSDRSAHIPEGQTSHNTEVTGNHSSCSDGLLKSPADAKCPCQYSKSEAKTHESQKILSEQIDKLTTDLKDMKSQRDEIEKKYTDLTLEVPSTEKLVQKLNALEKDNNAKIQDMTKLNNDLNKKNQLIKELQEENDLLSTQVMESISEVDDLKKELDSLKATYDQLMELQKTTESIHNSVKENSNYLQCESKDDITKSVELKVTDPLITLSICPSDSPGSRLNEISPSQIELLDRKNICKNIIEDVASMAMDLDESMGDANTFSIGKDCEHVDKARDLVQQNSADLYAVERMECLKYYIEKTGEGKENFSCDVKLIDVLKSLYNNLVSKHNEEVENLVNKLRDFEDSKSQLQAHFDQVSAENDKLSKTLYSKNNESEPFKQVLASVRANIEIINRALNNTVDQDNDAKLVTMFKENVLAVLDTELKISTSNIFESLIVTIVDKGKINLEEIMEHYKGVKPHLESVEAKLAAAHDNLAQLKAQLVEREQENELLKAQNEKIREINRAVSLDIIHREQKMAHMIKTTYDQLVESNIIAPTDIDIAQPMDAIITILIHKIKMLQENGSATHLHEENVTAEVNELKETLTLKETELVSLRNKMLDTEKELMAHKTTNEDLNKIIERTVEDARMKFEQFQNQSESNISALKQTIVEKEQIISLWESKINSEYAGGDAASVEFVQRIEELINENENLKSVNAMITKERELASLELAKANEILNRNKVELDKLTADILVLRQTVNDNVSVIESMTLEAKALHEQNVMLKNKADEKTEECARLALNIKTHEKTAEVQTKIISRLHKQKEEDVEAIKSKDQRLDELTQKCLELQKSYDKASDVIKASKDEIEGLKALKKNLEERVLQLETDLEEVQARRSVEATGDNSRRRRQSLHDSKRVFGEGKLECHDHSKMEAVFDARSKPDDLFMDVDGDSGQSNRSTPVRLSRGRDSLQRQDHSDRDEGPPSRPSSVMATRRRRQSIHDLHRSALRHTPSPHDQPRIQETVDTVAPLPEGEVGLRGRLAACQQELEDLKERYRELDDECETCAQYLRERDAQCVALKKEKSALEQKVTELNARLEADPNADRGQSKLQHCDAAVNTDEDWANLHAVVVDRMSFDAEVERNRRLTRTNEELRYKNQDLKNTLQRAMEKYASGRDARELEMTKSELKACKEELEAARDRCRELDEECETCAEYLKERDDQCRRLREAKAALEAKLQEYEQDVSSIAQSAKKKRQSAHDHNRSPAGDLADAATDTSDDLLSYQVERDSHARIAADIAQAQDVQRLRQALDKVIVEKTALEHRLMAIHPTMYVATGSAIVQSQQLADMVKENQKLKRMNAKLVQICKKRGKSHETHDNQENEAPASQV